MQSQVYSGIVPRKIANQYSRGPWGIREAYEAAHDAWDDAVELRTKDLLESAEGRVRVMDALDWWRGEHSDNEALFVDRISNGQPVVDLFEQAATRLAKEEINAEFRECALPGSWGSLAELI